MTHLLDINVLVALFDSAHVHHHAAHKWLAFRHGGKLATFDTQIPVDAVVGASGTLVEVIPSV